MKKAIIYILFGFIFVPSVTSLDVPRHTGWVNDYAGVMDNDSKTKAMTVISALERQTSAEIAVVTLKSLRGENLEDFAVRIFEEWGIGKKDKDNGVLILFSLEDRKVRIETGYGIEGIINDGLAGVIIRQDMIPRFKQGDYSGGILLGVLDISRRIAKDAGVELEISRADIPDYYERERKISPVEVLLRFLFFIILLVIFIRHPFLFLLFFVGGRGGGYGGGGFGGGFGGFGGGLSGGGGSSGSW